jgi:phosphatidylethanolamine-binding protein (PEBP) family uncharacterized protein
VQLRSDAFGDGEPIPTVYTCDGAGGAPDLEWSGVPAGVPSLALSCVDPDAPNGTFTHWTAWDLDPGADGIAGGRVPAGARRWADQRRQPREQGMSFVASRRDPRVFAGSRRAAVSSVISGCSARTRAE